MFLLRVKKCECNMHEWYDRPQSAINIVDFPDSTESNPKPISDADKSFGEFISAEKLVSFLVHYIYYS